MRKLNFKRQSIILFIALAVVLLVPQIAYGATTISADTDISSLGLANGDILTISSSTPVKIYASDTSAVYDINIVCDVDTDLEIENIKVVASSGEALAFTGGTNSLNISGTNSFSSGSSCAGIAAGGATVLNISGTGTLSANGGFFGAGIGGGEETSAGTINILSGTITALGGNAGSGIGGGEHASGGRINVSGGTVTSSGGTNAAGIGGGAVGSGGVISISGGNVTAKGNTNGAGIGAGSLKQTERITISGGKVNATSGSYGAGIGGGSTSSDIGGEIIITGGEVTAVSTYRAAAIGAGYYAHCGSILITGGTVTAKYISSGYGAGIGCGQYGRANASGYAGSIRIDGGNIYALGGSYGGAGIGGGASSSVVKIEINGGTVEGRGQRAAGIGGGANSNGGAIVITGGLVLTDTNNSSCNDIGSGQTSGTGTIDISGDSALFLQDNRSSTVNTTTHVHLTDEVFVASGSNTTAYGYTLPSYWTGNAYVWTPIAAVPTPTPTATPTATATPSVAPSSSASASTTPSATVSPSASVAPSPSASPTTTASPTASPSASVTPSALPTTTVTPSPSTYLPPSPSVHVLPTPVPTPIPTPVPVTTSSGSSTRRTTTTDDTTPSASPSPSAAAASTPTPTPTPVSEVIDEELIPAGVEEEEQPIKPANRKAVLGTIAAFSGAGLLILLFFMLTNLTVKVGVIINGKVRQLTKKRWILKGTGENKNQAVNFNIGNAHQPKLVGVVVKKGLAKRMRAGKVTVTINYKKYHEFDIPKDIDQRFAASKRFL